MATSFDTFYDQFSKRHDGDYSGLTEEEVRETFKSYLLSAIARFPQCYVDEDKHVNLLLEQIDEDLSLLDIEITVELMVLIFLEGQVSDITSYSGILTTSDYKVVSTASGLSEKESVKEAKSAHIDRLMAERGARANIAHLVKLKSSKRRRYY